MRYASMIASVLLALLALPGAALADRSLQHGIHEIHFNAMPSARLPAEVAETYNIPRSRLQGFVIVSVLEHGEPVRATIRGHARTDGDESRELRFRRVETGGRISHIGMVRIDDGETLNFELDVRPQMRDETYPVHFRETFYLD